MVTVNPEAAKANFGGTKSKLEDAGGSGTNPQCATSVYVLVRMSLLNLDKTNKEE